MDQEFWHSRWAENRIGFHLTDTNPLLTKYWAALTPKREEVVFVPLCGKSVDLGWLATKHDDVVGVELSEIAVRAFFSEHLYTPLVTAISPIMKLYQFDEVSIYSGDYFTAPLDTYPLIYDRAALIAMPQSMRQRYVDRLLSLLQPGGRILLVTLDYPQDQMDGPPFSVTAEEVMSLYDGYKITQLARDENSDRPPKGQAASYFVEEVWMIESK
ncbi:thiopurine S-methyltransferase [Enterovibrio norvegicus FF-162]|uniref:Thiopurine S-methyltransferase n=1 Tax=Enterovibrio norvegicus FF-454 TaxID=1185651 RepID=A0A1E5BY11_9GAMM|nr:thiopurine S-methyltransferase [Enterovibrio norvegicus]OEE58111.1 thiopurine S-methyltransferase [Enterovibrio norvegicus FF-454]OEE89557.1 thiopurine S-methyltransferase [Enterovibrio norvegicus FF-162]